MKCNFGKDCEWWLKTDWVGNNNKPTDIAVPALF
jgi:hypothetical protein